MRIVTWNVAGRVEKLRRQAHAVQSLAPDIVALQEITARTLDIWRTTLRSAGFDHVTSSFELASTPMQLIGPRKYGQLVASRFPTLPIPEGHCDIPWKERVLSATLILPGGQLEIHTTHVPLGASNGWLKIDHFRGLYTRLARSCPCHRLLCGDFNSPQAELSDGTTHCWGMRKRRDGSWMIGKHARDWEDGEQSVIT